MSEPEYKKVYYQESSGEHGTIGLQIFIASTEPYSENAKLQQVLYNAGDAIREELIAISIANDPSSKQAAEKERQEIIALFDEPIFVEEIPNGYCSRSCCRHLPWFVVTTTVGRFTIGWRKSVISIEWKNFKSLPDILFPEENVTMGPCYIHAYGYEKAKQYIKTIIAAAKSLDTQL